MEPAKTPTEKSRHLPLLLGLAIVLAGVLLWDRRSDEGAERTPRDTVVAPGAVAPEKEAVAPEKEAGDGAAAATGGQQGAHPLANLALDQLRDTVARPLFEKKRRPVAPPPRVAAAPAPAVAVPKRQADPNALTLLGILKREERGAIALFRRNPTGQHLRLEEGETVDGWTVDRIEAEHVVLRNGDTKISLKLFRKR
jgi:hypothetical protein